MFDGLDDEDGFFQGDGHCRQFKMGAELAARLINPGKSLDEWRDLDGAVREFGERPLPAVSRRLEPLMLWLPSTLPRRCLEPCRDARRLKGRQLPCRRPPCSRRVWCVPLRGCARKFLQELGDVRHRLLALVVSAGAEGDCYGHQDQWCGNSTAAVAPAAATPAAPAGLVAAPATGTKLPAPLSRTGQRARCELPGL